MKTKNLATQNATKQLRPEDVKEMMYQIAEIYEKHGYKLLKIFVNEYILMYREKDYKRVRLYFNGIINEYK